MPRKKIREFDAKRLLKKFLPENFNFVNPIVQVTDDMPLKKQVAANPWLKQRKLVVKPDMLFGQRGKHNLLLLNADFAAAEKFVDQKIGSHLKLREGVEGVITHCLVEPFTPHKEDEEYYLSIITGKEAFTVNFSAKGGIMVEENWESSMRSVEVPPSADFETVDLKGIAKDVPAAKKHLVEQVIRKSLAIFYQLDFTMLEFNPWVIDEKGNPVILDTRGELDDCAEFIHAPKNWFDEVKGLPLEFPPAFGKAYEPEEALVRQMDAKTGASLKLTIMNRDGRIWTLVAGGGASVIYADTVGELGFGDDLGNYGEYSGGPNEEETYLYAKVVMKLMIESAQRETAKTGQPPRRRALLIGGGIANFTDIAKTFKGIVHALKELQTELQACNCEIFVRRAGPNYKLGLSLMRKLGDQLGVPIHVNGPEVPMTHIVSQALDFIGK